MKKIRNWVNLTYSLAEVLPDDGFWLSLKRALAKQGNKDVFNSILKKSLEKGSVKIFSQKLTKDIFLQTNMILLLWIFNNYS